MNGSADDLTRRECGAIRRLARLLRIERNGGFARLSPETAARLVARRGLLIGDLIALEQRRRTLDPVVPFELASASAALAGEAARARNAAVGAIARLTAELRRRRGPGLSAGAAINGQADAGRLLGRG